MDSGAGLTSALSRAPSLPPSPPLQVWLRPDAPQHTPQYGSLRIGAAQRKDTLLRLLGGSGEVPAWPGVQEGSQGICLHQVLHEGGAGGGGKAIAVARPDALTGRSLLTDQCATH